MRIVATFASPHFGVVTIYERGPRDLLAVDANGTMIMAADTLDDLDASLGFTDHFESVEPSA